MFPCLGFLFECVYIFYEGANSLVAWLRLSKVIPTILKVTFYNWIQICIRHIGNNNMCKILDMLTLYKIRNGRHA